MKNLVVVTDFDKVLEDDFYLTDKDWIKNNDIDNIESLRELAKDGELFFAYVVDAKTYLVYRQMDAEQIMIDNDNNTVMICESEIIGNKHNDVWAYDE